MNHLMLSLETLSRKGNSPIAAIGAVFFEPSTGCTGKRFYTRVDIDSSVNYGDKVSGGEIKTLLRLDPESRSELVSNGSPCLSEALLQLSQFISDNQFPVGLEYTKVWGAEVAAHLRVAYERISLPVPWESEADLDVKTVCELGKFIGFDHARDLAFNGKPGCAVDDAVHKSIYVSHIFQHLIADKEPML
ncbi:exonuclease [Rahnella aquatilis CIP 78.65 = ATCC 33071]|uniref:3'-5' exoribonuclease Rv2179c-like domain-containing protein n=1 Tax=Rahnella aquatilis (strain ATCC 33071 / DSM 4594 / JCM 1683 / NBRC 105701 / NCIMB 13365 / CIP 78.65) TaxID=745277 RepID=H2IY61_RAHAC|nr:3'-5' exonuclease [Rahnella aquatilis]AEX53138.1 hypothetical protein Rahaq2_3334 [Rahnella aquatilis CIP 78.65 = ATCC 33071]KFD04018.1 exonuclease [Rahnella aquatilis CIP 78.65 = ATCC 33071]